MLERIANISYHHKCVGIILTYLTSLDRRQFGGVLRRDAGFKDGHDGIIVDAKEKWDRETFLSGHVGGAVQSRLEDAVGPAGDEN